MEIQEAAKTIAENVGLFANIKDESAHLIDAASNLNTFAFALWNASGAMGAFALASAVGGMFSGIGDMVSSVTGGGGDDVQQVEVVGDNGNVTLINEIKGLRAELAGMQVNIDGKRAGEIIFSSTPGTVTG